MPAAGWPPADQVVAAVRLYPVSGTDAPSLCDPYRLGRHSRRGAFPWACLYLVLRKTTERPEAAEAGLARIIGTDRKAIVEHVEELLEDEQVHRQMATATNPYGDGLASERIVEVLRNWKAGRPLLRRNVRSRVRLRLTTTAQDPQEHLPTVAADIGLFSDAMRKSRTVWPHAASANRKPIVP